MKNVVSLENFLKGFLVLYIPVMLFVLIWSIIVLLTGIYMDFFNFFLIMGCSVLIFLIICMVGDVIE